MIYWQIRAHKHSRYLLTFSAVSLAMLIIINDYPINQLGLMLGLIAILTIKSINSHHKIPVAISYHVDHWRCYHLNVIKRVQLKNGYVVGPIAKINFADRDLPDHTFLVVLFYWDMQETPAPQLGNWNQLRTILRYSQKVDHLNNDLWLS